MKYAKILPFRLKPKQAGYVQGELQVPRPLGEVRLGKNTCNCHVKPPTNLSLNEILDVIGDLVPPRPGHWIVNGHSFLYLDGQWSVVKETK